MTAKFRAIKECKEEHSDWSINKMCRMLEVKHSSYYKWLNRKKTKEELEDEKIALLVKEYDETYHHILGYRRMRMYINAFNHKNYSRKRIQHIMDTMNIHAVIRRKNRNYKKSIPEEIADNILHRNFLAEKPNEKWATDVTEFKIPHTGKKLYLSAIIDLYDRSVIAHKISKSNNNQLVFDTFQLAVDRNPGAKPLFHSDRGFQYTSKVFKSKLSDQGMEQSMSRVGHCIDNCPTEGLWGIIKTEMFQMYSPHDEASLREAIENYIFFYNNERLQERFNSQTPMQVRNEALGMEKPKVYPIPVNTRINKYWESITTKQSAVI